MQKMQVRSLDQDDPLEEGMATHPSILAWRIPWTEENSMDRGAWRATVRGVTKSQANNNRPSRTVWLWLREWDGCWRLPNNSLSKCSWPLSHVWLFAIIWNVALQAPLSMGFSRQEYWSGLPCPPPGDLPHSGMGLASLTRTRTDRRVLDHQCHLGSQQSTWMNPALCHNGGCSPLSPWARGDTAPLRDLHSADSGRADSCLLRS